MVSNVRARAYVQGGSTLTQQLAKNFYLTRERTIRRKITELLMAISIELRFSKERILEVYANEIFSDKMGIGQFMVLVWLPNFILESLYKNWMCRP